MLGDKKSEVTDNSDEGDSAPHKLSARKRFYIWISTQLEKVFSKDFIHSLKTASWFVSVGLGLILFTLLFEPREDIMHAAIPIWVLAFWSIVEKLGDALIVVGLIDIVIHLPDWNRYFLETIKDSIIEDGYLSRLDDGALKSLIGRALRARLKNPSISLETKGGFLDFFFNDIHALIGEPYRENAVSQITCQEAGAGYFLIEDIMTYTCREAGGEIQSDVKWTNDPGEIAEMLAIRIDITPPGSSLRTIFNPDSKELRPSTAVLKIVKPIDLPCRKDSLLVTVASLYKIRRETFQYWQMSHLTRNLTIILRYSPGFTVQTASFGLNEDNIIPTRGVQSLTLNYQSWILPLNGIAWKFSPLLPLTMEESPVRQEIVDVPNRDLAEPQEQDGDSIGVGPAPLR